MAIKPKYCTYCGKELLEIRNPIGYDPYTGNPTVSVRLQCPALSSLRKNSCFTEATLHTDKYWDTETEPRI